MLKVDILASNERAEYESFLRKCKLCSTQFSLDWADTICEMGEDKPYFVVGKDNDEIIGVLPLYYFRSEFGNLLTTIAWHTISGIACSRNVGCRDIYKALLEYSVSLGKELDCTALSIGTSPFANHEEYYTEYLKPDYTMENFVQYVRTDEIFDKEGNLIHPNYVKRCNLSRNLEKARLHCLAVCADQNEGAVADCFEIHEKRMKELNAAPIPKKFFDSVLKHLVSNKEGRFLFAFIQEKMIAGCFFLYNEELIDAYMMSMDSDFSEYGANFLLTYHMLKWAHVNGIPILHWMSSPRRGDGVYKWKEQWGSRERTFLYLSRVFGDISQWRNMDCNELAEVYGFHYLLPFNLLKDGHSRFTSKNELASFMQSPRLNMKNSETLLHNPKVE
jgi:hypothetical protein